MLQTVIKRNGSEVPFDPQKISAAISKAVAAVGREPVEEWCAAVSLTVVNSPAFSGREKASVEEIQDAVELALMDADKQVAQAYVRYRTKRALARKAETDEIFRSIIDAQANEITRENANMNADTPAGMMMKFASEAAKTFVDENLLSDKAKRYVAENLLHIHDKDYYPTKSFTCIQYPLDKVLENGFRVGHGEARGPRRIMAAAAQAAIVFQAVQNEMHGGQAIPAFDFYMAPYVRMTFEAHVRDVARTLRLEEESVAEVLSREVKDYIAVDDSTLDGADRCFALAVNKTVKDTHQAMESFVHNMNMMHSRGGNQVVFSSINYGTDTSAEGRCVIREILNTTYEGVGHSSTAIFPIQIWKKKRGVNYEPGDPNYDLYEFAIRVTARRFFPNFLNLDASYNRDEAWQADDPRRFEHEVATMGCRTRVYENRFGPKTSIGRGNLSFTTVNLPGIAIRCMSLSKKKERIAAFMDLLHETCDVAALQLDERFRFQATGLAKQFPMLMSGMWNGSDHLRPNDSVASVINQGTLGIGFIGLAEALVALVGKHHGEDPEAQQLGIEIISTMREWVNGYCEKYKHNYSVLATPAEGLAGRFTRIDRKRFGVIPGITDRDYYTNSNHVPVYYHCTPSHKAEIEGPYHRIASGGHIFYVEMSGDATHNPDAIKQVVDLMDRYDLGYGSVNHNRFRCLSCGYESAAGSLDECPNCHSDNIDVLQRITGYLVGTTERWNSGKKAELKDRVIHDKEQIINN